MKKRIIFSNYDDLKNPYYGGGGAFAIHEIAKRLTTDYHIKVLTGKYPGSEDEIKDGVFYQHIGLSLKNPQVDQLLFQLCLPIFIMRERYNLWLESYTPPFSTSLL